MLVAVCGPALVSSAPRAQERAAPRPQGLTVSPPGTPSTVNPDDILYILPITALPKLGEIANLRARVGEGPYVKVGFSQYVFLKFQDWNVDTTSQAAVRAALAAAIVDIDAAIADARQGGYPLALNFSHAQRDQTDPAEVASQLEDVRNMQWYQDNRLAKGWWTHSRYARRQLRVQEAYWREIGRIVADRMARYPETLVGASGDAEPELVLDRANADPALTVYADYSPFAIADFRDWITAGGLYATGAAYAGEAYELSSRYVGDASPAADSNGDGHTFNGDFGTTFTTWNLRYGDYSPLTSETAGAIPGTGVNLTEAYPAIPVTETNATGFDAPRARGSKPANYFADPAVDFWKLWLNFRVAMLHRHNTVIAQWVMTSASTDTDTAGATIPKTRWSSYQIPGDYLFNGSPAAPNSRFESSGSSWTTADVSPYGSAGFTAFNINLKDRCGDPAGIACMFPYFLTLQNLAPAVASRNLRFSLLEWHPSAKVDVAQTENPFLYDNELALIKKYRPTWVAPFMWGAGGDPLSQVNDTGFETMLKQIVTDLGNGLPSSPLFRSDGDTPGTARVVNQPFTLTGYAVDQGKVRGSGRDTGIDEISLRAVSTADSSVTIPLSVSYKISRADAANQLGPQFMLSGWKTTVAAGTLPEGTYDILLAGHSTHSGLTTEQSVTRVTIPPAAMSVNHSSLLFSALKVNGAFTSVTDPQDLLLTQTGSPKAWTVTSNQPWLVPSVAGGTGTRPLQTSVDPTKVPATATSATGTLTFATTDNSLSAVTVNVTLKITATTSGAQGTSPPTGSFDTPAEGQTVSGTIAVTGWALDDIGITKVEIWRDAHSTDPAAARAVTADGRNGKVYIGNGNFVEGARPDIEGASPDAPRAYRAGWGYIMLTRGLVWDGHGPFKLHAFAFDVEGNITQLGSRTITVANATSVKPFGAIDTPGQGETVSGTILNFGWVLAAPGRTVAADKVFVYIDNIFVGSPSPGDNRADLDAGFGPQGIDTSHANRVIAIDTTQFANGVHTIGWYAIDDAGNADGFGSRFIKIQNSAGTGLVASPAAAGSTADPIAGSAGESTPAEILSAATDEALPVQVAAPVVSAEAPRDEGEKPQAASAAAAGAEKRPASKVTWESRGKTNGPASKTPPRDPHPRGGGR